ncbi:MAG: hypothetical protein GQ529_12370 [Methyloprofundus sp.]|nr:hypothetical protein [Methyloprofundus sp.]
MSGATLAEGLYIYLTPAGCYYAVSAVEVDPVRQFLRALLGSEKTPQLNLENLQELMANDDSEKCLALLQRCQQLGWVQGLEEERKAPSGSLEKLLPELLSKISEDGKILLADDQGFYLSSHGYPHEVAEEISALSAELNVIHERRAGLLMKNMGLNSHAWAIVNASGNSQLGFWPLFIGKTQFVIALSGMPHFKQSEFISLVWLLSTRYAKNK